MISKKSICPICKKAYVDRPAVYNHMESQHRDEIPDGIPADQYFYDITHKYTKPKGCCICHKDDTDAGRYDFCGHISGIYNNWNTGLCDSDKPGTDGFQSDSGTAAGWFYSSHWAV